MSARWIAAVGVAVVGLVIPLAPQAPAANQDAVKIETGLVSGTATGGVRSFRGIPYAAPPVGDLRWRPPFPPAPWTGVRDGSDYGPECPQTQYPNGSVYVRPMRPLSEDCLSLNVWTPAKVGERQRLPVFVWIHGGVTRGRARATSATGTPPARAWRRRSTIGWAFGYRPPRLTARDCSGRGRDAPDAGRSGGLLG
jgi:para-nitrobenzyl esterase